MIKFRFIDLYAQTFFDNSLAAPHLKTAKPQTFNDLLFEAVNGYPKPHDDCIDQVLAENMQDNLSARQSMFSRFDPVLAKYRAGDDA